MTSAEHCDLQQLWESDGGRAYRAAEEDPDVTRQDWYSQAVGGDGNKHFSTPHIQNLFDDGTMRYYWVISLSRAVELTNNGESELGVLLVDMDYSSIFRMMRQINESNSGQYYYLCDSNGEIIYHPRQIQISDGIASEIMKRLRRIRMAYMMSLSEERNVKSSSILSVIPAGSWWV